MAIHCIPHLKSVYSSWLINYPSLWVVNCFAMRCRWEFVKILSSHYNFRPWGRIFYTTTNWVDCLHSSKILWRGGHCLRLRDSGSKPFDFDPIDSSELWWLVLCLLDLCLGGIGRILLRIFEFVQDLLRVFVLCAGNERGLSSWDSLEYMRSQCIVCDHRYLSC